MEIKDLLNEYSEFKSYTGKSKDKIIDYIILLYSKDSKLIHAYPNLVHRKAVAAEQSGMNPSDPYVIAIMEQKDESVLPLINCYLQKIQHNYTFERMISDMEAFSENQRFIRAGIKDWETDPDKLLKAIEIKGKLSELSKRFEDNIQDAYNKIYGDNEDLKNREQKIVRTTPENFAKKHVQ